MKRTKTEAPMEPIEPKPIAGPEPQRMLTPREAAAIYGTSSDPDNPPLGRRRVRPPYSIV
jgi:hypothetical protein